jgi:hypothetical protein
VRLLKLNLVVNKVTTGIERISLRAVDIRRTRNIAASGKLATHLQLAPRLRMHGDVMQLFHKPSRLVREQYYICVKL